MRERGRRKREGGEGGRGGERVMKIEGRGE